MSLAPHDMGASPGPRLASRGITDDASEDAMGFTTDDFPPVGPATFTQMEARNAHRAERRARQRAGAE